MRFGLYAVVSLLPFYLLIHANAAWTPHPRFFPDDVLYARMCLPSGLAVYWGDFGFYRLLAVPAYALLNRVVMRVPVSPAWFTLSAMAGATVVFVWTCLAAGLSKRRGAMLAGLLLGSSLLLETINFWSGTFNYALVLLLLAAQLRASRWARREQAKGFIITACGALLALLTYEIALPFILATSALYVRGWGRRIITVCVACVALVTFVAALAIAGWYWPLRFKLMAEQLAAAVSDAPAPRRAASSSLTVSISAFERVEMYGSLLFSFIRTGLKSWTFWGLFVALTGLSFLSRPLPEKASEEKRLPENLMALCFAFALFACLAYLFVTGSLSPRYIAFLVVYGAAALAWTKGRAATFALAALLLVQAAVAASLPVHLRDVELVTQGQVVSAATGTGDMIAVDGRLVRASWGKRFLAPQSVDVMQQPLSPRACRYAVPCERCPSQSGAQEERNERVQ